MEYVPACLHPSGGENAKLLNLLPRKLVDLEARRSRYRWAGYRFMRPLECTRQFAADYRSQFSSTFYGECHFEPEVGSPEFKTLWEMRLAADECHMSYPMYLDVSLHLVRNRDPERYRRPHMLFAGRHWQPLWKAGDQDL